MACSSACRENASDNKAKKSNDVWVPSPGRLRSLAILRGGLTMRPILVTFLIVVTFIGGCVFDGLISKVPPDASTRGRLMRLKHELADFYARNKSLPESLDALGKSDSVAVKSVPNQNAWGGPILYSVSNGTLVILKTYGPGGAESEVKQTFTLTFDVNERRSYGQH